MKSIILGLDPGSRCTGFGLLEMQDETLRHIAHGAINVSERLSFAEKLHFLDEEIQKIFLQYRPQICVVERIFLGKNADSAFKLGHVRGICLSQAVRHGSQVYEYAARSIKKAVTGSGGASKEHVRVVVEQLLRIKSEAIMDATDALSLAIGYTRLSVAEQRLRLLEMQNL